MSKPDSVVSLRVGSLTPAADTAVSMPVENSRETHEDAMLLLHAMSASTSKLSPTSTGETAAFQMTNSLNPTPSRQVLSLTDSKTETELDLAACLVALSRSKSPGESNPTPLETTSMSPTVTTTTTTTTATTTTTTTTTTNTSRKPTCRSPRRKTRASNKRSRGTSREKDQVSRKTPKVEKNRAVKPVEEEQEEAKKEVVGKGTSQHWEARFKELKQYKAKHGHANPTAGKLPRQDVARWLKDQRQLFRNDLLATNQVQRLRGLGCIGFDDREKYATQFPPTKTKAKAAKDAKKAIHKATPPTAKGDVSTTTRVALPRLDLPATPEGKPTIREPNKNDVICGRGASIYKMPGNVQFRSIVALRKLEYLSKQDNEKMPIAAEVVSQIRNMKPSGRFLAKHENGFWYDVGDKIALKKTSMSLRQDARAIREADTGSYSGKAATAPSVTSVVGVAAPATGPQQKKRRAYTWEERYSQLEDFKSKKGHANPQQSKGSSQEDQKLAKWLSDQRKKFRKKGALAEYKRDLLCALGCDGFDADDEEEESQDDSNIHIMATAAEENEPEPEPRMAAEASRAIQLDPDDYADPNSSKGMATRRQSRRNRRNWC